MLSTPEALPMSEAEAEQVHQTWSTFNEVINMVQMEGFAPLQRPSYECPSDHLDFDGMTSFDSRRLANEFGRNKAWQDFAMERLTYTQMILTETKNELSKIETLTRSKIREEQGSKKKDVAVNIVRAYASEHNPRYDELLRQQQKHEQLEYFYNSVHQRFVTNVQLVSRVLTMRGQDISSGVRGVNVGAQGSHMSPVTKTGF